MATQAEVRDLIQRINQTKKYKVVKSGSKHHKVVHADGPNKNKPVTDANGPLIISGSPSDARFREMTVKRLMGAKVFTSDPYKATPSGPQAAETNGNGNGEKKKGGLSPFADPEKKAAIHEAKVKAIKAKSAKAMEETGQLRSRLEPVVSRIGGWGDRGGRFNTDWTMEERRARTLSLTELGAVARHWAESRGREEAPRLKGTRTIVDVKVFAQAAGNLKLPGHTLGDQWRPFWTAFVDELYRGGPDPNKAASRYWELYREMRGLVSAPTSPPSFLDPPAPREAAPSPEPADQPKVEKPLGPAHDRTIPHLALEAMYLMASGTADYDQAMKVAERIAKLELEQ